MYELQTREPGLDWGGDWAFESRRDAFTGARLLMDFFPSDAGCGVRILLSDTTASDIAAECPGSGRPRGHHRVGHRR